MKDEEQNREMAHDPDFSKEADLAAEPESFELTQAQLARSTLADFGRFARVDDEFIFMTPEFASYPLDSQHFCRVRLAQPLREVRTWRGRKPQIKGNPRLAFSDLNDQNFRYLELGEDAPEAISVSGDEAHGPRRIIEYRFRPPAGVLSERSELITDVAELVRSVAQLSNLAAEDGHAHRSPIFEQAHEQQKRSLLSRRRRLAGALFAVTLLAGPTAIDPITTDQVEKAQAFDQLHVRLRSGVVLPENTEIQPPRSEELQSVELARGRVPELLKPNEYTGQLWHGERLGGSAGEMPAAINSPRQIDLETHQTSGRRFSRVSTAEEDCETYELDLPAGAEIAAATDYKFPYELRMRRLGSSVTACWQPAEDTLGESPRVVIQAKTAE